VVWQLLPTSIRNRQSKIGNPSHPGPSDDRRKSSLHEKKMKQGSADLFGRSAAFCCHWRTNRGPQEQVRATLVFADDWGQSEILYGQREPGNNPHCRITAYTLKRPRGLAGHSKILSGWFYPDCAHSEHTLMWSQKNLFAHLTASCYRSDGSGGAWDSAREVGWPSTGPLRWAG